MDFSRRLRAVVATTLPLLLGVSLASAQEERNAEPDIAIGVPVPNVFDVFDAFDAFGGDDVALPDIPPKQLAKAKKAQEKNLRRRLSMRIGQLQKTCNLSATQVRRLQLAAKGAVQYELKGFDQKLKDMRKQMMGGGVWAEVELVAEEEPFDDVAMADESAPKAPKLNGSTKQKTAVGNSSDREQDPEVATLLKEMGQMFGPMEAVMGGSFGKIEDQKLWQSALKKTLTAEQYALYEELVTSRKAFKRRSGVMNMVASLDEKLLFTQQQRDKMSAAVDEQLGKFFEVLPAQQAAYMQESLQNMRVTRSAYSRLKKTASTFLNASQLEEFGRSQQGFYSDFGFLFGWEEAGFMPAAEMVEVPDDAGFLGVQLGAHANGVMVEAVMADLAADKAGLKIGDIITKFAGTDVGAVTELLEQVAKTKADQTVAVTVLREDKTLEIAVKLGTR